jgi:DNA processing protein
VIAANHLTVFDPNDEMVAAVALSLSGVLPQAKLGSLVDQVGSAVTLVQATEANRLFAWPDSSHEAIGSVTPEHLQNAELALRSWKLRGLEPWTVLDPRYPEPLHEIFNRPLYLFVRGQLEYPTPERAIAVVGARSADDKALSIARDLTKALVRKGYVIVSGLAKGIDTAAHTTAITEGGSTWAVLGSGVERVYPTENAGLASDIVRCGGALISQFAPEQPPTKWTFPMRNVVMSGLTQATVVVEASQTSGARLQARVALQHGRTVFLHSRLIRRHEWAQKYIVEGAYGTRAIEIDSALDILARLEHEPSSLIPTAA